MFQDGIRTSVHHFARAVALLNLATTHRKRFAVPFAAPASTQEYMTSVAPPTHPCAEIEGFPSMLASEKRVRLTRIQQTWQLQGAHPEEPSSVLATMNRFAGRWALSAPSRVPVHPCR